MKRALLAFQLIPAFSELRLLFPGFFDERVVHSSEVRIQTATLLDSVQSRLEDELFKSLEYEPPEGARREELRRLARRAGLLGEPVSGSSEQPGGAEQ